MGLITQDIDTLLYKILNASSDLKTLINGKIYKGGFRPTNSGKEDISINTIALTRSQPQIAASNINIHIPDVQTTIGGNVEFAPDTVKLKSVGEKAISVINAALVSSVQSGHSVRVSDQRTFRNDDNETKEHFQNIRIELIIPNT